MSSFIGILSGQGEKAIHARARHAPGTLAMTADGRTFRYIQYGGLTSTVIQPGSLIMGPAPLNGLRNLSMMRDAKLGDTSIAVMIPNIGIDLGEGDLAYGMAIVATSGGAAGDHYQISGHPIIYSSAGATSVDLPLAPDDPITRLISMGSGQVTLEYHPFRYGYALTSAVLNGPILGIAPVTANGQQHGWIQTGGMAALSVNGDTAAGIALYPHKTSFGQVTVAGANVITGAQPIGVTVNNAQNSNICPVMLTLPL